MWTRSTSRTVDWAEAIAFENALFSDSRLSLQGDRTPLLYPLNWLGTLEIRQALAECVDYNSEILIHEQQELAYEGRLLPGKAYEIEIGIGQVDGRDRRMEVAIAAFDPIGRPILRMRTLLRILELDAVRAVIGDIPGDKSAPRPPGDFFSEETHSIDEAYLARYLDVARDDNPIHRDGPILRRFGLAAPILPGMLIFALIARAAASSLPKADVKSISCRFLSPLTVPAAVAIRRRIVRSKPVAEGTETISRLLAGTAACPVASVAETFFIEPLDAKTAT